ncbi:MAG TPA: thioesterase family protein [Saprospiraceae bacterium]|nr:thioesterase family protein [Saprospiraceae bacterium]HMQ85021.1 thioesterase family protein [Saprospiraceae bacterium]
MTGICVPLRKRKQELMISFDYQKRVRYGETDQMKYLYYGNYAQYYEIGRVEMLRNIGLTYKEMEEEHRILMPVVSMQMRFVRPAYYDELLTIRTTLRELPDQFIVFHMELFNEKGKLVNGGTVKLCFFDEISQKTVPAPEFLLEKLRPSFEADQL